MTSLRGSDKVRAKPNRPSDRIIVHSKTGQYVSRDSSPLKRVPTNKVPEK